MADTNKYNRNFRDFGNYPYQGKNMPEYYDDLQNAGDGNPGLQYMIAHYVSTYGPYHVIEGCSPIIDGTDVTGTTGFVMMSGSITTITNENNLELGLDEWFLINTDGNYASTGAKPTGVLIARNISGVIFNITRRLDTNSQEHFPNDIYTYGSIQAKSGIEASGEIYLENIEHIGQSGIEASGLRYIIDNYIPVTPGTGITNGTAAEGTCENPSRVNDGDENTANYAAFDTDEYVRITFSRTVLISKFGDLGHVTPNGNGIMELRYWNAVNNCWTGALTFTEPGIASWTWWSLPHPVIAKEVEIYCTQEDSLGECRITEIKFE